MSFPYIPHEQFRRGPASGAEVTIERMYYTLCQVCGAAFNDWTDNMAEARRNRREHLDQHKRSTEVPAKCEEPAGSL